jgi:hypothetical protein
MGMWTFFTHVRGSRKAVMIGFICGLLPAVAGCAGATARGQATGWPSIGLRDGIAPDDVQRALGKEGTHQFTAVRGDSEYLCLSVSIQESTSTYYLVFVDDGLTKVVEPLTEEFRDVELAGAMVSVRMPFDPFDKVEKVLSRPSLSDEDLAAAVDRARARKPALSFNQTPAAVLTLPALALEAPRIAADYARNRELARRYSPAKVRLGMPADEVDGLYGMPYATHAAPAREMRVYGEAVALDINPAHRFSWVAVVFEEDRAIAVFTHDFFHAEFLSAIPPGWR